LHDTFARRQLAVEPPPSSIEDRPFRRSRVLLIERSEDGTPNFSSNLFQNLERKFLWPERFTGTTKTLVNLGDGGQAEDVPILATGLS
jgi:hypothetical protein